MAKGPGVSATSRIIAQSQTNIHYYSDLPMRLQQNFFIFINWRSVGKLPLANGLRIHRISSYIIEGTQFGSLLG